MAVISGMCYNWVVVNELGTNFVLKTTNFVVLKVNFQKYEKHTFEIGGYHEFFREIEKSNAGKANESG